MRIFVAIVGLLLLLSFGSQTVRHIFKRWIEPNPSVLAPFSEPAERQVAESKSLKELVGLYAEAHEKVEAEEKSKPSTNDDDSWRRRQREPYRSEATLFSAIETWEEHERQIREVQFFWWTGLALVAVGLFSWLRLERWFGLCTLLLGFLEMSYATCPTFDFGGSPTEFSRLLTCKAIYSTAALAIFVATWAVVSRSLLRSSAANPTA